LEQALRELKTQVAAQGVRDPSAEAEDTSDRLTQTAGATAAEQIEPSLGSPNFVVDGFYSYNFNRPANGQNVLRAYDRTHNSFGLNQAALVFEHAPDLSQDRRFGARIDLMYGQATKALQGSLLNEPDPETYRPLFQAYGTYIAPVGSGLQIDFGKWASALGLEGNYTKDQVNYSRSYLFNFLPFYHFGFRSKYQITERWGLGYWLVNGSGQTEDFNGFKSNAVLLHWNPSNRVQTHWTYYFGNENMTHRANATAETELPSEGPADGRLSELNGKLHIGYGQALWSVTDRLRLAAELAYVNNREFEDSTPTTAVGGGLLASLDFSERWSLGARYEKISDRHGFLSGQRRLLGETTLTLSQRVADGFLVRYEIRRDTSDQPFFPKRRPDSPSREQTTALLGLTWWVGSREGAW
jgi:hypothetical protein